MGEKVTDPDLLKLLQGGAGVDPGAPLTGPVTDPALLSQLAPKPDGAAPQLDASGRIGGLLARGITTGAASGVMSVPALAADAGLNLGYGARKLAAKAGLVEPLDPAAVERLYGKDGGYFPAMTAAANIARKPADMMGAPEPETAAERIGVAAVEGVAGALSPAALGTRIGAGFGAGVARAMPGTTAASGALAGVAGSGVQELGGTGPASTAAGVGAGILPFLLTRTPGAVTNIRSEEGQRRVAAQVLRESTGTTADDAARRIEAGLQTTAGRTSPELREFQHTTPSLVRDPALATQAGKMREWAGGRPIEIEANNSSVLSRALDANGAGEAAATREAANTAANTRSRDLVGGTQGRYRSIEIAPLLDQLQSRTRVIGTGATRETAGAFGEIREALMARAVPVRDVDGNVIGQRISPQDLAAARKELGQARHNRSASNPYPMVAAARGETLPAIRQLDDLLDQHVRGPNGETWRADYLAPQAVERSRADVQGFLGGLKNKADRGSMNDMFPTERALDPNIIHEALLPKNANKRLKPDEANRRGVSLNDVRAADPRTGGFLDEMSDEIRRSQYEKSPGVRPAGSNTSANINIERRVAQRVQDFRGPLERILGGASEAAQAGSYFASHLGGPAANMLARGGARAGRSWLTSRSDEAQGAIRGFLGEAYASPEMAARMYRMPGLDNEMSRSLLARRAGRAAYGAAQGFMADENNRAPRYR